MGRQNFVLITTDDVPFVAGVGSYTFPNSSVLAYPTMGPFAGGPPGRLPAGTGALINRVRCEVLGLAGARPYALESTILKISLTSGDPANPGITLRVPTFDDWYDFGLMLPTVGSVPSDIHVEGTGLAGGIVATFDPLNIQAAYVGHNMRLRVELDVSYGGVVV